MGDKNKRRQIIKPKSKQKRKPPSSTKRRSSQASSYAAITTLDEPSTSSSTMPCGSTTASSSSSKKLKLSLDLSTQSLNTNNCNSQNNSTSAELSNGLGNAVVDLNLVSAFLKTLCCPSCSSTLQDVSVISLGGLAQKLKVNCECGYETTQELSRRVGEYLVGKAWGSPQLPMKQSFLSY